MGRSFTVLSIFCVLAAAVAAVMAQGCNPPEGESRLVIGADAWIDSVCVDGKSYCWPHGKHKKNSAKCNLHTINIPYEATVIGIKATNHHAFAGMFACVKGTATGTYGWWMCQKASAVTDMSWCSAGYDDSDWQDPATFKISTCQKMPSNQCGLPKHSWFWLAKERDIVCRLQKCAKNCKVCDKAGPGKCDDPKYCYYGSTVDPATGLVVCKSSCTVDIQSYGTNQPDSEKVCYARIKNAAGLDYIDSLPKTYYPPPSFSAGEFVNKVNVTYCNLTGPYLDNTCNNVPNTTIGLNTWAIDPTYINVTALDITLDKGEAGVCSYAPFVTVWIFDGTNITGNIQYLNNKYTNVRFSLTETEVRGYRPVFTVTHTKKWQPPSP